MRELRPSLGIGRRGPWPGQGANDHQPWWGLCEETPQLWAHWLAEYYRRKTGGRLPERAPFRLQHAGREVAIEAVRHGFGFRWYFRCPICGRRTEVLYLGRQGLACRRCNRLGYRSQARRATAPLDLLRPLDWRRTFGRYQGTDRQLAGLAHDLAQGLSRQLEELFAGLQIEPEGGVASPSGEHPEGGG
ncbi:hypothetical protein [Meiothermus taiwanensis]|uniref:Uncharacterized protein n=1 Tax=Meiothermus taiwanensis TaxID=172827 RepID=A0A399E039_9DEIN|nr:hypothetical protein [Meiothermus taiwanensis]RIH78014.1 hypothetical protein Mcate_01030 [Meiothermus taiwanensis]